MLNIGGMRESGYAYGGIKMINDECDVKGCSKRATTEIEIDGSYQFVCDEHIEGDIVRHRPTVSEDEI